MRTLKIVIPLLVAIANTCLFSQRNWVTGASFCHGFNNMLIRKQNQKSMAGHSYGTSCFLRYKKPRSGIFIEPGAWFGKNTIRAEATEIMHLKMKQYGLGLACAGGIMIRKKSFVKAGVLSEYVGYPVIEAVSYTGFHMGHSAFSDHIERRAFLTAMTLGIGTCAGESRFIELFFQVNQYLLSPFLEPYNLRALGLTEAVVFNARALTTTMMAGITIKFVNPAKKPEE